MKNRNICLKSYKVLKVCFPVVNSIKIHEISVLMVKKKYSGLSYTSRYRLLVKSSCINSTDAINFPKTYLPSATKLRQGNVFTPVCHSVHRGVCHTPLGRPPWQTPPWQTPSPEQTPSPGQTPPWQTPLGRHLPLHSACWDTVNKRAVRILVECNLVEAYLMQRVMP